MRLHPLSHAQGLPHCAVLHLRRPACQAVREGGLVDEQGAAAGSGYQMVIRTSVC